MHIPVVIYQRTEQNAFRCCQVRQGHSENISLSNHITEPLARPEPSANDILSVTASRFHDHTGFLHAALVAPMRSSAQRVLDERRRRLEGAAASSLAGGADHLLSKQSPPRGLGLQSVCLSRLHAIHL